MTCGGTGGSGRQGPQRPPSEFWERGSGPGQEEAGGSQTWELEAFGVCRDSPALMITVSR